MIVVADTTPLNYLILIRQIHLLHILYGEVTIPPAVAAELNDPRAPEPVRKWFAQGADWLNVRPPENIPSDFMGILGPGEQEAIALSIELNADALLLDERDGRAEAERRNLIVIGTLRILSDAADLDLLDLPSAFAELQVTNFRASSILYDQILVRHERRKREHRPSGQPRRNH